MKTIVDFKRLLAVAGFFFVFVAGTKAEYNLDVRIFLTDKKVALLLVNNPEKQRATLYINDMINNQMVYSGRISKDLVYRGMYDLSGLPEGNYKLTVEMDNRTYEKEIEIGSKSTKLLKERVYYAPEIISEKNILKVRYLNPVKENVTLSIIDGFEAVYTDNLSNVSSFKRNYRLKDFKPGTYTVELVSGEKKYYHPITVY
ncbi:MAG: hypothetical protein JXB00_18540 [Bacteroidales bacterium]|nr:hypothetical protein [Bacteroidales bacterium]